jgi:hypothetical protein
MNRYAVTLIKVTRIVVVVAATSKGDASGAWRSGELVEENLLDQEVIDVKIAA